MVRPSDEAAPTKPGWRSAFVRWIYARHNQSPNVHRALSKVLATIDRDSWGLNVGSADTVLHPRLVNLDLRPSAHVHALGTAERLPFSDNSFACLVSQEVFEHLANPLCAGREVARVLRPDGLFYLQVPFIIGSHSTPNDYWRFSGVGLRELVERMGLEAVEIGVAVGAGTSMYRISVEYWAALAAAISRRLYLPAKITAALLLAPLRWTDVVTSGDNDWNRVQAGFYAIARKVGHGSTKP